jgi:hypothetical protein
MTKINWPEIINALVLRAKLTQPEIARLCSCGQSTVSDLLRGNTTDPRVSTGLALLQLARKHGLEDVLPDPAWPHPGGRPTIDVAGPAVEVEAARAAA